MINMQYIRNIKALTALTLIAWVMTLTSCRDHTPEPNPVEIKVSDTHLEIGSDGRYYLLEVDKSPDQIIAVDTDVDWIEFNAYYVPDSGNVEIHVTPNDCLLYTSDAADEL